MAEITKEEYRASAARGVDLRHVAGAWLVCALIASMHLPLPAIFRHRLSPHWSQLL